MPLYEYRCTHCGFKTEKLQARTLVAPLTCDHCQNQTLQRVISAPKFKLEGGGWYTDGYQAEQSKQSDTTQV